MTKILALDTSTNACSAALLLEGEIHERFEIAPRRHASLILPMIEDLLNEQSVRLVNLDAIAFGQGPGSFMGLRIAAGIAQGLAFGSQLSIIPISSLQALAQAAYQQTSHENILAAWDARMHAMYWGAYTLQKKSMQPIVPDALNAPADIVLPNKKEWLLAGNAWQIYASDLSKELSNLPLDQCPEVYPTASAIALLASEKLKQGETLPPSKAQPNYLRNKVASKQ